MQVMALSLKSVFSGFGVLKKELHMYRRGFNQAHLLLKFLH